MDTQNNLMEANQPQGWYDRDGKLRGSAEPVPGKCGAQLGGTRPARYCLRSPIIGRTRCRKHGGLTPCGAASPQSKTLKYARHMPKPIAEDYAEAVANKERLLDLKYEVAILEGNVDSAMQKLGANTWSGLWDDLQELSAASADPECDVNLILARLRNLANRGQEHEAARREVEQAVAAKARLVAIESKRMLESSQIMTLDEVTHLFRLLSLAIKTHVKDQSVLNAVNADFQSIVRAALPAT